MLSREETLSGLEAVRLAVSEGRTGDAMFTLGCLAGADLCAASVGAPHIRQRLYWVGRRVADADEGQRGWFAKSEGSKQHGQKGRRVEGDRIAESCRVDGGLVLTIEQGLEGHAGHGNDGDEPRRDYEEEAGSTPSPGGGFWDDAVWIPCADGKARRIEPGLEPLAYGVPARVGRLRGYGNAIVPAVAARFLREAAA